MKLEKVMTSLAVATAAGLCLSAFADNPEKGQSGTLNLTDPVTNASVVASGDTLTTVGGTWNEAPSAEGGYMVIDCDAASSNEFTATTTTGAVVQCDFDLQVAPVPLSARPESAPGAQTAFCVCTNAIAGGAAFFCAYVGVAWTNLTGFAVPASDAEYCLRVTFDYKSGKYVKFSVKLPASENYTDLGDGVTSWFATGSAATGVSQYCFVGTGNVKSFATAQANVASEDASVTPPGGGADVTIEIPEEALAAVPGATTEAKATALMAESSVNSQPKLSNYILFGLDNNGAIKEEAKPVSKIDTVVDGSGNIPLSFNNLNVQEVAGTTVTYTLKGRKLSTDKDWDTLATGAASAMKITTANINAGYKFFKVSVDVSYTGK